MTTQPHMPLGERLRDHQARCLSAERLRFDYVVCGAGTSGCVTAARLAADPAVTVLLVEAGGSDEGELVSDPNRWPLTLGGPLDWGFVAEPNPHLGGRAIPYAMGRVLGGGSAINVSTWSRGHRADWDLYASEAGDAAWSHAAVRDLYRERIEARAGNGWAGEIWAEPAEPGCRGTRGPVHVQSAPDPEPFALALLAGAEAVGLERFEGPNGRMMEGAGGCAPVEETVREGARRSIFRSYVHPRLGQPNLTVLADTLVGRVLFDGPRATGVTLECRGRTLQVEASVEVVLSLGAIHTPKLLMQSGIGEEAELARHGIPVRLSLPGVGRHLHDHVAFGCVWESADGVPRVTSRSQVACFWQTSPELDAPNFYAYAKHGPALTPENGARFAVPPATWSLIVGMRPKSRGRVRLTGPGPRDPVLIQANYLAEPDDMRDLVQGVEVARSIGNSAPLRPFTAREVAPGPLDRTSLERFFRNGLGTFWHQSGTARMGRDPLSVVDGELAVHGTERLRVADASVLPRVTTGNTMAPCVVIGERAAEVLGTRRDVGAGT